MQDNPNPYAAPDAAPDSGAAPLIRYATAGMGLRLLEFIIDFHASFILAIYFTHFLIMPLIRAPQPGKTDFRRCIGWAIGLVLYYSLLEASCGRTLGKGIVGTKAVQLDGSRLTMGKALGRTLSRLIPFDFLSIFITAGTPWHDSLTGTKVIQIRGAKPILRDAPVDHAAVCLTVRPPTSAATNISSSS